MKMKCYEINDKQKKRAEKNENDSDGEKMKFDDSIHVSNKYQINRARNKNQISRVEKRRRKKKVGRQTRRRRRRRKRATITATMNWFWMYKTWPLFSLASIKTQQIQFSKDLSSLVAHFIIVIWRFCCIWLFNNEEKRDENRLRNDESKKKHVKWEWSFSFMRKR